MVKFLKQLLAKIQLWLYGPPCTYTSCDADKDDKEQDKEPQQGSKCI